MPTLFLLSSLTATTTTTTQVESKREASEVVLREMGVKSGEAEAAAVVADVEREKATAAGKEAHELQTKAAIDLAAAQPLLEQAQEAVASLDLQAMAELKAFEKVSTKSRNKKINTHTHTNVTPT
jgi:hypothetical protein